MEYLPEYNGFNDWLHAFALYRGKKSSEDDDDDHRIVGKFKVSFPILYIGSSCHFPTVENYRYFIGAHWSFLILWARQRVFSSYSYLFVVNPSYVVVGWSIFFMKLSDSNGVNSFQWLVTDGRGSTPVSTVLWKWDTFFKRSNILIRRTLSKLKFGQYPVWMTPKHRKGDLGVKLQNISWGSPSPDPARNLRLRRLFRESVSICPRTAPNWLLHVLCVTFSAYLTSSTCLFLLRGLWKYGSTPCPNTWKWTL